MTPGSISRRYAKALFELASEEGSADDVGTSLAQLAEAVASIADAQLAPGVLSHEVRQRIAAMLTEKLGAGSTIGKFIRLVAERDRLVMLPQVHEWYRRLQDLAAGRVRLHVMSAVGLGDAVVAEIASAFERQTDRHVIAETQVDGELIGGVVAEIEGRVYDGSVRTRLQMLSARMAGVEF
jgi:F-type H+-transporting ATPase subunit delta